jgi:hypothetical protein
MSFRLDPKKVAQLSAAAATGLVLFGCNQTTKDDSKAASDTAQSDTASSDTASSDTAPKVAPLKTKDGHACCMGLNECKGKGGCAVPESNGCAGKNECKGKGGCNMHCPK